MISASITDPFAPSATHDVDLDTFFDVSLDLLIVRDINGPVLKASPSWFTVLGYHAEELVGVMLISLIHPDDLEATRRAIQEVTHRGLDEPALGQTNRYRHKDGHYVTLEWRARRFGDRIYAVARDVTQKVAHEQALLEAKAAAEAANRAKSDFLANMSHEIRTPLNGVIGIVDALSRTALDPVQAEMVNLIRSSGVTLERLVSDILDVSKIEAGELTLETRAFDLDEALDAPLEVMRVRADEKALRFEVIRDEAARGVFIGDSTRIRQVISNLLSNAVKFTHQGEVAVRIALDEDQDGLNHLIVDISDTGVGFDAAHAARLFDRFSQADATITRRFGGTGLGLSICRALVEMMGGRITAESTPGVGSRFKVEIPLARSASLSDYVASERARASEIAQPMRTIRVLLAEDHPTNQRVVQLILAGHPVELITVEDGAAAVAAFETDRFDVILMDMQMPGMDGLSATRRIRALESARAANAHTPIIMLSANAMAQHRDQAIEAGADIHVPKPITAANLLAGIQSVLAA
ncbi:PAS domain-containing hybrid sensor histidine kinase/response regulator [Brevundimonas sp. SL130]|uniref:PAS domain-containing hybrid sensor histidine kinase/response regulator n=1 Tax=Brevundimonas sp. SL130 TaxID=2995143 RepID=UPI00226C7E8D|nr:PAS domain-containing hybrid sensor histidine kinase/response regulator [Brevundimonas sp. SL130]WAC60667.1 ATP-binding protein [Brevundimonas sp. SL130]